AGDVVSVSRTVVDFYERKGGALQFLVIETVLRDRLDQLVSISRETLVLPQSAPAYTPATRSAACERGVCIVPPLQCGKVTREMLARFAPASGDLNPVHLDPAAARNAGYGDVFAHGMLSMAWLGRFVAGVTRQENVRSFRARF